MAEFVKPAITGQKKEKTFNEHLIARTAIMEKVYDERALMRDIEDGITERFTKGKYIFPFAKESKDSYNYRLDNSIFFNVTNRMIKINYNRPFGKESQLDSNDEFLKGLQSNFDSYGNSLTDFGKKFFKRALYDSQAHVFCDLPESDGSFNPNQKPTAFVLNNDNILGARCNDYGEIIHLRFVTDVETPHFENPFDVYNAKRIYIFDKIDGVVYYQIFDQVDDENFNPHFEQVNGIGKGAKEYYLDYIPVVSFYPDDTDNYFYPKLIFKDLAMKNIEYFRSSSDQTNILHVARVPILFLKGMPENVNGATIGASMALVADENAENADGKYIEINGNSINAGRQNMNDIITQMESLGLELMSKQYASATASTIDNAQNLSLLTAFALKLQDKLKEVVKVMIDLKKKAGYQFSTEEFELQIDTKFSVVVDQQELQFMQFLRSSNDISGKTITNYAKSLGYLPASYDYQKDQEYSLESALSMSQFSSLMGGMGEDPENTNDNNVNDE